MTTLTTLRKTVSKNHSLDSPEKYFSCPYCHRKHFDFNNHLKGRCISARDNTIHVKCTCSKKIGVVHECEQLFGFELAKEDQKGPAEKIDAYIDADETKVCQGECKQDKPLALFYLQPTGVKGHAAICIECSNKANRDRKQARKKENELYGIF
jgi:hypothetical protein